ncbi:unnamed protein product [Trifolium pratense]|uniref:Uncharacterized protein n=1 Tax=Trifolium pratense TaxID=57577 RepID=A0ACB0KIQ1_TRIPR|nr:unnamed protein product [Trifolium pratense]
MVAAIHVFAIKMGHQKNTELKIQIEIEFSHARIKSGEQQAYICVPLGGKPYGISPIMLLELKIPGYGSDNTISTYYTALKKLWQELDNFRPIPASHCVHNCTHECAAIAKMKSYKESDQVIRFLKGLNEPYHAVRSQIMLMDPLPSISKVYSLLVQQERQIVTPVDESKLLVVSGNNHYAGRGYSTCGRGNRGGRSSGGRGKGPIGNKLCSHCGQTNHVVDNCWKKYGYPPHMQHLQQDGAVNNIANTDDDDDENPTVNHEGNNNDHETSKFSLTAAQHKALTALLQGFTSMPSHSINHVTRNTGTIEMAEVQPPPPSRRTLGDYGRGANGDQDFRGFQPANPVAFDIRSSVIKALKENKFSGAYSECPNLHLSLRAQTHMLLDVSAGGSINNKVANEAKELVEAMAQNEYRALNEKGAKNKVSTLELDTERALLANFKLMNVHMETFIKHLTTNKLVHAQVQQVSTSQAQLPTSRPSPLEETLSQVMKMIQVNFEAMKTSQEAMKISQESANKNHEAYIKNLETQMGQLSRQVASSSNGGFEGNTCNNPKKESCNAIHLRSRVVPTPVSEPRAKENMSNEVEDKVVKGRSGKEKYHEGEVENERNGELEKEVENKSKNEKIEKSEKRKEKEGGVENERKSKILKDGEKAQEVLPHEKLPYPHKKKSKRKDIDFKKFMEMFNSLQVTIPFMEALEQMPVYAKFMKELLTKKRKPKEDETVLLTEECSAILQRKLPQKKKDPGSFTIPCSIGNLHVGRALCDLGASINLMSLSMMKKIPGAIAKPTKMQLSLADRSITYPYGILQDVLVRVAEFVFPADFVILDMEENAEVPLLLGRPFLATGRALIDVEMGDLMLRFNDEKVNFNIFEGMRNQDEIPQCFKADVIEDESENSKKEATKSISPDLKALPPNGKFVFLGDDCKQPVIVSRLLTPLKKKEKRSRVESNLKYPP